MGPVAEQLRGQQGHRDGGQGQGHGINADDDQRRCHLRHISHQPHANDAENHAQCRDPFGADDVAEPAAENLGNGQSQQHDALDRGCLFSGQAPVLHMGHHDIKCHIHTQAAQQGQGHHHIEGRLPNQFLQRKTGPVIFGVTAAVTFLGGQLAFAVGPQLHIVGTVLDGQQQQDRRHQRTDSGSSVRHAPTVALGHIGQQDAEQAAAKARGRGHETQDQTTLLMEPVADDLRHTGCGAESAA